MMRAMLLSWRTSAFGVLAIVAALADVGVQIWTRTFDGTRFGVDVAGLLNGIGLLFAKDQSVTGAGAMARKVE